MKKIAAGVYETDNGKYRIVREGNAWRIASREHGPDWRVWDSPVAGFITKAEAEKALSEVDR